MKKIIGLVAIVMAILLGCESKPGKVQSKDEPSAIEEKEHPGKPVAVQLNNGERWDANPETTSGIEKMAALATNFQDKNELAGFHDLKGKLESEFNLILQNCTMSGEAHNQLHNYLVPMKTLFDELGSSDIEICRKAVNSLKTHLEEYGKYFI